MQAAEPILDASLYDLMMDTMNALAGAVATVRARSGEVPLPVPTLLQLRAGYAESPGWILAQAAEFDPGPLTVERFCVRDIYGSPALIAAFLELMSSEQWLDRNPNGSYSLAAEGRAILSRSHERQRRFMSLLAPLSDAELREIYSLLTRIIRASLEAPDPPGTWCLAHSRNRAPADDECMLMQIQHYFDDFNAFRDDAHMAAFRAFEPEGHVWEAFSHIHNGEANDLDTLYPLLAHRGYLRADYGDGLEALTDMGWLQRNRDDTYTVTGQGKATRAEAERHTDSYFYAPWSVLSAEEIARVPVLLAKLRDGLNEIAEG
ncbi:MAG: hypothetical protein ABI670_21870 [Chloroflexota bacterium]